MALEYFGDFYAFFVAISALIICMFSYITFPRRGWMYALIFFLCNQISNYYWTVYVFIIGDYPNASQLLAYAGWDIQYIFMLLLVRHFQCHEEKRYFNVLMLIPVPLNIWQFILYIPFGGIANNVWQGVLCTSIACVSIQSIMWYIKERRHGKDVRVPYIAIVSLIFIASEYGMWTSSCFDWDNDWVNPYTYISLFSYTVMGTLPFMLRKIYGRGNTGKSSLRIIKYQNVLKWIFAGGVFIFCVAGVMLGLWVKNKLIAVVSEDSLGEAYVIIVVMLFVFTVIVTVLTVVIMLLVGAGQRIIEKNDLKKDKELAEQANKAKSEFLASMSHEIRTPINAVLGMNEMILRESRGAYTNIPDTREQLKEVFSEISTYASNVDSAGNNLLSIVNDILDFSKIESGRLEIVEDSYKLGSMINDISNMVVFRAKEKNLEFIVETDEELPAELGGDEMRVRQIVINLLTNAVKYTEKGSVKLSVKTGNSIEDGRMDIIFSVTDTGIGIRKEDMDSLFVRFQRFDIKRNKKIEGTGLGLAITYKLTKMMNGTVEVESEYGKGSTFTLKIPQKVLSDDRLGSYREQYVNAGKSVRVYRESFRASEAEILVVDDNRLNLLVLQRLLNKTAVKLDTAMEGRAAINLADEKEYDVILMDNRMPEMDGSDVLKAIRASSKGKNRSTPVICLTADAVSDARERYIAEGFSDYMSKPVRGEELEKMLLDYIPEEKIEYRAL